MPGHALNALQAGRCMVHHYTSHALNLHATGRSRSCIAWVRVLCKRRCQRRRRRSPKVCMHAEPVVGLCCPQSPARKARHAANCKAQGQVRQLSLSFAYALVASAKAQEEFDSLKQQKEEVEGKMADLKEVLYGKFGREHINLEE